MSANNKTSKQNDHVDERKEGVGQGELYSPAYAIKINPKNPHENGLGLGLGERGEFEGDSNTAGNGVRYGYKEQDGVDQGSPPGEAGGCICAV